MIYLFEQPNLITDKFVEEFLPNMPAERQNKALKYSNAIDRNMCVAGYWLLCHGLRNEYGISEYPQFSYNDYGKPSLTDFPHIHFNISHCKTGIACAISQNEVGIDIQDVQPYNPLVAERVCTAEEMEMLNNHSYPEHTFCKWWAIKESHLKFFGASLECIENKVSADWILTQSNDYVFMHRGENFYLCCFGEEKELITIENLHIESVESLGC